MPSELINVPGSISTPISLGALMCIVVYLLYRSVVERLVQKKIGATRTFHLLRSVINWIGVLSLVVLVMVLIPSILGAVDREGSTQKENKIAVIEVAMFANHREGFYDAADKRADEILAIDPSHGQALNMKGAVAFYRGEFRRAIQYFTKALQSRPNDTLWTMNLADSYVEVGGYERAIELYESVANGTLDWLYAIGRAYMYAGKFDQALTYLQAVPTEADRGRARVLEAASLAGSSAIEGDSTKASELVVEARERLLEGINQDPHYWNNILAGDVRDIHEGHTKARELLRGIDQIMPRERQGDCCRFGPTT